MEINFVFAQNPELRRVSYGLLRGDELSDDERSSASHCLTAMFRTFENQYYAYHEGTFSESIWRGYRENVVWNTQQANFVGFWADRARLFGEEFVSFVDDLVNEHKRSQKISN